MTDRPTPEQILDRAWVTFLAGDGILSIRAKSGTEHISALAEHGYVVVHPRGHAHRVNSWAAWRHRGRWGRER